MNAFAFAIVFSWFDRVINLLPKLGLPCHMISVVLVRSLLDLSW
jgi:hypothetical protein